VRGSAGGVALAAILLAAADTSASPYLRAAPRLPLGDFPWGPAIAAGDFDGDGRTDAAYSRSFSSGVALMRGDGTGGFHAPIVTQIALPVTASVVDLHAADLNADGRLDLAQSDFANGFIVYLGLGDGRFAQALVEPITSFVASSAVGDLDGDGTLDLALALWGAGSQMLVYRGHGDGTFAPAVSWALPSLAFAGNMAADDLDGDGRDDLAVTDRGGTGVMVLRGTPTLALSIRGTFDAGGPGFDIALGDLNGDGRLDAAVGHTSASGSASALLGDGTGAFALVATVTSSPGFTDVELADLDGDGRLDLATYGSNLWVRPGDGTGHFGAPERFGLTGRIVPAELTGDGLTDLLVGQNLFAGSTSGDHGAQRSFAAGAAPRFAVADDFDRDGRPDLVVANATGAVHLLRGDGAAGFAPPTGALYGSLPTDLVQGDFDRDGWPDVAVAYEGTRDVVVLRNDRAGGWTARSFPQGGVPRLLAVDDFGGDGIADIAVANETSASIDVLHGLPDGAFAPGGSTPFAGQPLALVAGRFNADDRADLVISRMPEPNVVKTAVLVGTGLETFVPGPQPELPLYTFPRALIARDLDGDGRLDLAAAADSQPTNSLGGLGGLGVLLGDGDGHFDPVVVQPPERVFALAAADFTLDGRPDLAILPEEGGALRRSAQLLVGTAGGGFASSGEPSLAVGVRATAILTRDLDGDGRPDAVAVTEEADAVTVLRGRAPGAVAADLAVSITAAPDPVALGVPFHYRVTAVNHGPSAAEGVRLRFVMPLGLTVLSSTPGSPLCVRADNVFTCDLAALASGAPFVFETDVMYPPPTGPDPLGTPPQLPGQAFGWAQVTALTPGDPSPADNLATSYVSVGPIDLVLAISDSVDPVSPGQPYRYRFSVTNAGAYPASHLALTTQLPQGVTLVGVGPGCADLPGHIGCFASSLAAGETVSFDVDVLASSFTTVSIEAHVDANEWELVPGNNTDREETSAWFGLPAELTHGVTHRGTLPPGDPAQQTFTVLVPPHASYEVVLDEASGDYGNGPTAAALDRMSVDTITVLQASVAAGTGTSRILRWQNTTEDPQRHLIRLRSRGCSTDCGADDGYRLRAYETTAALARYNTTGGQATVVLVQNRGHASVAGTLWFADGDGQPAGSRSFALPPRAVFVLNVATLLPGRSGSLTLSHDAGYGGLAAKAIAIEPANGTSYDTVLQYRAR
jgi:uncharacterized repeat protein (TIGR01451 family)